MSETNPTETRFVVSQIARPLDNVYTKAPNDPSRAVYTINGAQYSKQLKKDQKDFLQLTVGQVYTFVFKNSEAHPFYFSAPDPKGGGRGADAQLDLWRIFSTKTEDGLHQNSSVATTLEVDLRKDSDTLEQLRDKLDAEEDGSIVFEVHCKLHTFMGGPVRISNKVPVASAQFDSSPRWVLGKEYDAPTVCAHCFALNRPTHQCSDCLSRAYVCESPACRAQWLRTHECDTEQRIGEKAFVFTDTDTYLLIIERGKTSDDKPDSITFLLGIDARTTWLYGRNEIISIAVEDKDTNVPIGTVELLVNTKSNDGRASLEQRKSKKIVKSADFTLEKIDTPESVIRKDYLLYIGFVAPPLANKVARWSSGDIARITVSEEITRFFLNDNGFRPPRYKSFFTLSLASRTKSKSSRTKFKLVSSTSATKAQYIRRYTMLAFMALLEDSDTDSRDGTDIYYDRVLSRLEGSVAGVNFSLSRFYRLLERSDNWKFGDSEMSVEKFKEEINNWLVDVSAAAIQ